MSHTADESPFFVSRRYDIRPPPQQSATKKAQLASRPFAEIKPSPYFFALQAHFFAHAFFAGAAFFATAFFAGAFFTAAFFAGAFLAATFFAGAAFFSATFFAGAFLATAFFAGAAFFATAFFAGAFFAATAFLAGAFLATAFFAGTFFAAATFFTDFFAGAFLATAFFATVFAIIFWYFGFVVCSATLFRNRNQEATALRGAINCKKAIRRRAELPERKPISEKWRGKPTKYFAQIPLFYTDI